MFILSNVAVVIAYQSLITATFSLLFQASTFDFFPPLNVTHTVKGQVYISVANWVMMVVCLGLILFFKVKAEKTFLANNDANPVHSLQTSSGLATAFGVAVTGKCHVYIAAKLCKAYWSFFHEGTFACTTIVFMMVANLRKRIPLIIVLPIGLFFLFIDLAFFTGNIIKFTSELYWLPLLLALILLVIMVCWKYSSWIRVQRTQTHRQQTFSRQVTGYFTSSSSSF